MTFDEDVDALKRSKREWRYFYSLGPLTIAAQPAEKRLARRFAEAFLLYFTPFGLITMAFWPEAFSD